MPIIVFWFVMAIAITIMRWFSPWLPVFRLPVVIPVPISFPVPAVPVFLELSVRDVLMPVRYMPVSRRHGDHGPGDVAGFYEYPWPIIGAGPEPVIPVGPIPVAAEKQDVDIDRGRKIDIGPGDRDNGRRHRDHQRRRQRDADPDIDIHFRSG
jgi:hypothetical protein